MQEPSKHFDFYIDVMQKLLDSRLVNVDSSVLVICGGPNDRDTLSEIGFKKMTFCNLDSRLQANSHELFAPHDWAFEDAEKLSFPDQSFDLVVVHSGLHHLHLPSLGLTEMYRVARIAVVGFEPNNCFFTRLGVRFGFGQAYETAAVYYNDCKFGGVDNTQIPNHVFRFDKNIILQTIRSYDPTSKQQIHFHYRTRVPSHLFSMKNKWYAWCFRAFGFALHFLGQFPMFANNMAFVIVKPDPEKDLHPWLEMKDGEPSLNPNYLERLYNPCP